MLVVALVDAQHILHLLLLALSVLVPCIIPVSSIKYHLVKSNFYILITSLDYSSLIS
jgi:hypothetical protein